MQLYKKLKVYPTLSSYAYHSPQVQWERNKVDTTAFEGYSSGSCNLNLQGGLDSSQGMETIPVSLHLLM